MKLTQMTVEESLSRFVSQWKKIHANSLPTVSFDHEWPSPCYLTNEAEQGELIQWQPVRQEDHSDMFQRLSEALGVELHPDIVAFYTQYWSDPMAASAEEGNLELLQVWNPEDMERLRSNLIGHALAKHKQKRDLTLFFACTEPDEGILSLMNHDGSIWLEYPGKPPVRKIADSLSEFLDRLQPR